MNRIITSTIIIFVSFLLLNCALLNAQAFNEGDNAISVGYGFGVIDGAGSIDLYANNQNQTSYSFIGPFYLKYEHALTDKFAISVNLAYGQYQVVNPTYNYYYNNPYYYTTTQTYSSFSALARLNWHFGRLSKFDPYWGFGVGYRESQFTSTSTDPSVVNNQGFGNPFPFGFEITVGARYYLTNMIALYLETGFAKSVVQLGVTFKLRKQVQPRVNVKKDKEE